MTKKTPCDAPKTSCGSASGWRAGGRCYRCREAHNLEVSRYRGLRPEQRALLLASLRAGAGPEAAAEAVGVSPATLPAIARNDSEVWAALDGQPEAVQRAAKVFDFLAALVRTGGDYPRACQLAGVTEDEVASWRINGSRYIGIEAVTLAWMKETKPPRSALNGRTGLRTPDDVLDRAVRVLADGGTLTQAAREVGMTSQGLRYAARRYAPLRAVLPPPKSTGRSDGRGRFSTITPEIEQKLTEWWADPSLSKRVMALRLDISQNTLHNWAQRLGLPAARSVPARRGSKGIS